MAITYSWASQTCGGMDVVERIIFVRQGDDGAGHVVTASAVYVTGADEQKLRADWAQSDIDDRAAFVLTANSMDATIAAQIAALTAVPAAPTGN